MLAVIKKYGFSIALLLVALVAVWRLSDAIENSGDAKVAAEAAQDAADTTQLYAQVQLCDGQYEALERDIDSNAEEALTLALQTLPLEQGETGPDPRGILLAKANDLSRIRGQVAALRFRIAYNTLQDIIDGNFNDFVCRPVPPRFIEAARPTGNENG